MKPTVETRAYFSYLRNCKIEGGISWYVSRIENCELVNSSFNIVHNLRNTDGTSAHMYIKNVKGIDFKSRALPFQSANLTAAGYQGNALDYVLHYEDCEIDASNATGHLFSYEDSYTRTYNNIILDFKNCRITGAAPNRSYTANTSQHEFHALFDNCLFNMTSSQLFGSAIASSYRYFEFKDCKFNSDEFKLSTDVALICGGEVGTTSNRPKLTSKGSMYYDTTLSKPVWRNTDVLSLSSMIGSNPTSVVFKDASGTTV